MRSQLSFMGFNACTLDMFKYSRFEYSDIFQLQQKAEN